VSDIVPRALRSPKVLSIAGLLRPHWIPMTLALLGVAGEAAASLLEPWPLKSSSITCCSRDPCLAG
jgi:hypothetical protein